MHKRQRFKLLLLVFSSGLCTAWADTSDAAVAAVVTFSDKYERLLIQNLSESTADIAFVEFDFGMPRINSGASKFRFFSTEDDLFEVIDESSTESFPYGFRARHTYPGFAPGVSTVELLDVARINELEPLDIVRGGMVDMSGATATVGFTNGETFTRRLPDFDLGPEPEPVPTFDGPGVCGCFVAGTSAPAPTYTLHDPIEFSSGVTTVPLPASVWFLISSLMACGFIRRKR